MKNKRKVSAFEYAIMEAAGDPRLKEFEPYTREEETERRIENIKSQAEKLRFKKPN